MIYLECMVTVDTFIFPKVSSIEVHEMQSLHLCQILIIFLNLKNFFKIRSLIPYAQNN